MLFRGMLSTTLDALFSLLQREVQISTSFIATLLCNCPHCRLLL